MGMMTAKLKLLQQYIGYYSEIISIILLKLWKLSSNSCKSIKTKSKTNPKVPRFKM